MSVGEVGESKSRFTFIWKITNFSACSEREFDTLKSPRCTSAILGNSEWELWLHPIYNEKIWVSIKHLKGTLPKSGNLELFFNKTDGTEVIKKFNITSLAQSHQILSQNRNSVFREADLFLPEDTLTVGCCIEIISEKFLSEKLIAHTEISTEKVSIVFPFSISGMQQLITVPLNTNTKKYPLFEILLDSCFHSVESLKIYVKMAKSDFRVFAACQLSLRDPEGDAKYLVEEEHWFEANKDDEKWELKNSLPHREETFCQYSPLKYSVHTLHCRLSITDGTHTSYIEKGIYPSSAVKLNQESLLECQTLYPFKEKLRNLYTNKRLCDFTVQVDGKQFPVHKTVLGTVSPVFCAMFERDMTEKKNSLLIIEDIDADTMEKLIDFAYFESVDDLQWNHAVKLYSAADKYQIPELKQHCVNFMIPKITLENVTDALIIADLHQDRNLEKAVKSFIFVNAKQLFSLDGWKVFMETKMEIAIKIMHEVCIKLCENFV